MDGTWTISELAEQAAAVLAVDGSAQVSGRVRDLPNERLIRWYTTIGLVDPPLGRRGRSALYGRRHLLQLVAVKRRQAAGRSIAEIQVELTGATDASLERIASLTAPASNPAFKPAPRAPEPIGTREEASRHLSSEPRTSASPPAKAAEHRENRGHGPARASSVARGEDAEAPTDSSGGHAAPSNHAPGGTSGSARPPADRPTNTTGSSDESPESAAGQNGDSPTSNDITPESAELAATSTTAPRRDGKSPKVRSSAADTTSTTDARQGNATSQGEPARGNFWSTRPDVAHQQAVVSADYGTPRPTVVQGVRLAPGLTLLLDVPALNGDDLAAIDSAARPLVDELRRRGLLADTESPAENPAPLPADISRRST